MGDLPVSHVSRFYSFLPTYQNLARQNCQTLKTLQNYDKNFKPNYVGE